MTAAIAPEGWPSSIRWEIAEVMKALRTLNVIDLCDTYGAFVCHL